MVTLTNRIEWLGEEVSRVDPLVDLGVLSAWEIKTKFKAIADMWSLLKIKDSKLIQRSRSKWLKFRDANLRFYHGFVKSMSKRNAILALHADEVWIQGFFDIRQEVLNHFTEIFKEFDVNRPHLDGVVSPSLSDDDNFSLFIPFSFQELDVAVSQCKRDKSLGHDGFNFSFF